MVLNTTSFPRREVIEIDNTKQMVEVPAMGYSLLKEAVVLDPPNQVSIKMVHSWFTIEANVKCCKIYGAFFKFLYDDRLFHKTPSSGKFAVRTPFHI